MTPIIEVTALTQGYGKTVVLRDVNLRVARGEILALIGPSGAGKSTLVKTIMGMRRPLSGTVTVFGTPMPSRAQLANIGYMAQSDALYDELTARKNVQFFATMMGLTRADCAARLPQVAAVVNLEQALDKRVGDYSGGMKRRLSLVIALIADPPILVLDEPTVGIDPELRQQIWQELHRLATQGKTILLTTHVMEDAEEADAVVMVRDGTIIAQGTPAALTAQYDVDTIEAVFLAAGRQQDAHNRHDSTRA